MFNATNMSSPLPYGEDEFSPMIMSYRTSKAARLAFMLFCSIFGTITNIYFVSSFIVEKSLQKIGNTYLACTGMADLLLTAVVMTSSSVILLSGQWDSVDICRVMQVIGQTATYAYSLFFMMAGLESYFRICRSSSAYRRFLSVRVEWITGLVSCLSIALSVVGVSLNYDYDYCERKSHGNINFRIATMVLLHGIPAVVTFALLVASKMSLQLRARTRRAFRRSRLYKDDYSTISMNITAHSLFVLSWLPCVYVVYKFPDNSGHKYYYTVWVALFRSVFTSLLYGVTERTFQQIFARLFRYCHCRSEINSSQPSRQRRDNTRSHRPLERKRAALLVRAHALQQIAQGNDNMAVSPTNTTNL